MVELFAAAAVAQLSKGHDSGIALDVETLAHILRDLIDLGRQIDGNGRDQLVISRPFDVRCDDFFGQERPFVFGTIAEPLHDLLYRRGALFVRGLNIRREGERDQ